MSGVRKKDQTPHRLTVLDALLDMFDHTIKVTDNPKIFTEQYKTLTDQIRGEARLIYHYCRTANEDLDNRIEEEALERLRLEREALKLCSDLKTDIMLAKKIYHLKASKAIAWTRYVDKAIPLIRSWHNSEKIKYREHFGS